MSTRGAPVVLVGNTWDVAGKDHTKGWDVMTGYGRKGYRATELKGVPGGAENENNPSVVDIKPLEDGTIYLPWQNITQ